ncbi:MAG TPA: hypothetical protein VNA12_07265 [Mycobacteriales bacterium]|nr:hypothetical protein [Mycobacteriales bacterium]
MTSASDDDAVVGSAEPTRGALDAVSSARSRLGDLDTAPVAAHVDVLDEVHDVLQATLAGLDER